MKQRKATAQSAPEGLSEQARDLWTKLTGKYVYGDDGRALLQAALQSLDEAREAQALLRKEGSVVSDSQGRLQRHPASLILKDSRLSMIKLLKAADSYRHGREPATKKSLASEPMPTSLLHLLEE